MRYLFIMLFCPLLLWGCAEEPPYQLPENAEQLLTGDSLKRWKLAHRYNDGTRVNMNPCYINHLKSFYSNGTFNDNNGDTPDCGASMEGRWSIRYDKKQNPYLTLQSSAIPEALGIDKDFKDFKIGEISEEKLVLLYSHTLFTDRATFIVDTFVPEQVEVPGRNFHW